MSPAAKNSMVFGFYALGMGLGLFFIPNPFLGIFGIEPTIEIWVRVLGLLAFCLGIIYFYCARTEQAGFFRISITERVIFFLGMAALVLVYGANPILALFGSVELIGALWMGLALRKTGR